MNKYFLLVGMLKLVVLTGCTVDRNLSFPAGSERVAVTVKAGADLAVHPVAIGYRSTKCTVTRRNSDFEPYEVAASNVITRPMARKEGTDFYQADVAVDGGGRCQWRLSYIEVEVNYTGFKRFGDNVAVGGGGRAYILLDKYNGPAGGTYRQVPGDLVMREDYYVQVRERFIGGHSKRGSLLRNGDVYLIYRAPNARSIYFEPVVHSDYPVFLKGPPVKADGLRTNYFYPDGSVVESGGGQAAFRRLQCIRLPSECQK